MSAGKGCDSYDIRMAKVSVGCCEVEMLSGRKDCDGLWDGALGCFRGTVGESAPVAETARRG